MFREKLLDRIFSPDIQIFCQIGDAEASCAEALLYHILIAEDLSAFQGILNICRHFSTLLPCSSYFSSLVIHSYALSEFSQVL